MSPVSDFSVVCVSSVFFLLLSRVRTLCVIRARAHTTDKDSNIIRFPEGFAVECCAGRVFCGAEGEMECKKLNYLYFVIGCGVVV